MTAAFTPEQRDEIRMLVRRAIAEERREEAALNLDLARAIKTESSAAIAHSLAAAEVEVVSKRLKLFRDRDEDRRDPHAQRESMSGRVPFDDTRVEVDEVADLLHETDHSDARLHDDASPSVGAAGPESSTASEPSVGDAPGAESFGAPGAPSGGAA